MRRGWIVLLAVVIAGMVVGCGASNPTAEQVVTKLQKGGLPVGEIVVYTAETDKNRLLGRPGQYTSKVNFHDTRLVKVASMDIQSGGSVEVFATSEGLKVRKEYVERLAKALPMANEYDYSAGVVLLRLSHSLTPEQAEEYQKALVK